MIDETMEHAHMLVEKGISDCRELFIGLIGVSTLMDQCHDGLEMAAFRS